MVFRVSHHKSLSDPIYYPYLQIETFEFSVWLHIFDHDFRVRFRDTELCSEHRSVIIVIFPFWWLSYNKHSISRSFEKDRFGSPADRKRASVQRPRAETVSTYLLLCLVDNIFVHPLHT